MRDLLAWLACAWALGVALAALQPPPRSGPLLVGAASLGAACAARRLRPAALVVGALAGGALGFTSHPDVAHPLPGPVEVGVEGRVVRKLRQAVVLAELRGPAELALPGSVVLRDPDAETGAAAASLGLAPEGARIRTRARLRPLQRLRNPGAAPGGFDLSPGGVGRPLSPGLWVARGREAGPLAWLRSLRERIALRLARQGPGGALLAALAVGRRDALDPALRDAIARCGLGHLLAVSGLHLALVAGFAFALARRLLALSAALAARFDTRRGALLGACLAASGYALLSGGAAPVQRAWVCLALPCAALLLGRTGRLRASLAAALLALLVRDPLALFSPGAQLSFVAAAALSRDLDARPGRGASSSLLRASATAMLATAPLVALHFTPVTPLALLLNWVAVPWTACVLLPAALLGAALASWGAEAPGLPALVWLGEGSLAAVGVAATWLGEGEGAPPARCAIALAAVLAWWVLRLPGSGARLLGCLCVSALLALAPPARVGPGAPRVVVLDVGQGDSILVEGRRASVLVDAGMALPEGPDRGRDVVLPALRALGVERLDLVVVTHADLDHRGGVPAVLAGIPVTRLWLAPGAAETPEHRALLELARRRGVSVQERGADSPAEVVGDLVLRPLWPPAGLARVSSNDRSLVLQLEVAGRRVLLPGDLESAGERALLSRQGDLRADVLVLGHHGSETSSSQAFLAAVAPRLALVSAPCLGRFAMPHPEVVARLASRRVPLYWTGRDGALSVALGAALRVEPSGRRRSHCGAVLWRDGG